jgi:hypothetical protein
VHPIGQLAGLAGMSARPVYSRRGPAQAATPEVTPMAAGEAPIKQAVRWLDDQLRDHPRADRMKLVDEAARRFDLSPLDAEFLLRHLAGRREGA